jgi:glycerol-3-phosphate acyltransferase PlsX
MGLVFARVGLGVGSPRVGLLSIGEEPGKGNALVRAAHRLLRDTALPFSGNVEARDLYVGDADVVVCDGFTGNVALKVSESMVDMVESLLAGGRPTEASAGPLPSEAAAALRRRVDHSEYGGAPLLGVAGPCVVGHGRSSARAVCNAIVLAHRFAVDGLVPRIEADLRGVRGTVS